jgi:hypothetical protein
MPWQFSQLESSLSSSVIFLCYFPKFIAASLQHLEQRRQSNKCRKNSADRADQENADTVEQARPADIRKYSAQNLQPPSARISMCNGARQQLKQQNSCEGGNSKQQEKGAGPSQFTAKNAHLRGSKEKIVYLRERKALKTIGIVVLGMKELKYIMF